VELIIRALPRREQDETEEIEPEEPPPRVLDGAPSEDFSAALTGGSPIVDDRFRGEGSNS